MLNMLALLPAAGSRRNAVAVAAKNTNALLGAGIGIGLAIVGAGIGLGRIGGQVAEAHRPPAGSGRRDPRRRRCCSRCCSKAPRSSRWCSRCCSSSSRKPESTMLTLLALVQEAEAPASGADLARSR